MFSLHEAVSHMHTIQPISHVVVGVVGVEINDNIGSK
jgi:hypothetical protein